MGPRVASDVAKLTGFVQEEARGFFQALGHLDDGDAGDELARPHQPSAEFPKQRRRCLKGIAGSGRLFPTHEQPHGRGFTTVRLALCKARAGHTHTHTRLPRRIASSWAGSLKGHRPCTTYHKAREMPGKFQSFFIGSGSLRIGSGSLRSLGHGASALIVPPMYRGRGVAGSVRRVSGERRTPIAPSGDRWHGRRTGQVVIGAASER